VLISSYDLEVFTPPCSPEAVTFSAFAHLDNDIRQALPYLNATLRNAAYNPAVPALVWRDGRHHVVFHPDRLAVSNLEDRTMAAREVDRLVGLVNDTWARRDAIEPSVEVHQRPTPMLLYKLLPGTNCRECGEPSCWNFALKLGAGQAGPRACPPLLVPAYSEQLARLEALVTPAAIRA
jgi:ArsR family metal-binding transcriptional regulator